jgi:hypothetical protein
MQYSNHESGLRRSRTSRVMDGGEKHGESAGKPSSSTFLALSKYPAPPLNGSVRESTLETALRSSTREGMTTDIDCSQCTCSWGAGERGNFLNTGPVVGVRIAHLPAPSSVKPERFELRAGGQVRNECKQRVLPGWLKEVVHTPSEPTVRAHERRVTQTV